MTTDKVKEIVSHAIEHTEEKAPVIVTNPGMGTEHAIREAAKDCVIRSMNITPHEAIDKTFLIHKHNAEDDPYNHHLLIVNSIDTLCHPEWKNNDKLALAARRFNEFVKSRPYNMTVIGISYGLYKGQLDTEAFEIHNEF